MVLQAESRVLGLSLWSAAGLCLTPFPPEDSRRDGMNNREVHRTEEMIAFSLSACLISECSHARKSVSVLPRSRIFK